MSPSQMSILELIEASDGKFSWYQIDRALCQQAGGGSARLVESPVALQRIGARLGGEGWEGQGKEQ